MGGEVNFKLIDITKDELPNVDMIFCRDCLQHLSNENVFKTLKNFKKSGSKYLAVTSYSFTKKNWDIKNGDYCPLNLLIEPFNLPAPIEIIDENFRFGNELDKAIYIYNLNNFRFKFNDFAH